MAGLAREFNKMSDQLSEQMQQLQRQREELDQSVRRIGEAFASGLDRTALLEIVIETALAACDAESGRIVLPAHESPEAQAGEQRGRATVDEVLAEAAASARSPRAASPRSEVGELHAIGHPLISAGDGGRSCSARWRSPVASKPFDPPSARSCAT